MAVYFIRTEATEDKPEMTCAYPYCQWLELITHFKKIGVKFTYWKEFI